MHRADRNRWRGLPAAILQMYQAPDGESARLRAAHLNAVVRLTPQTMLANVGSAAVILWAFWPDVPAGLWVWLALLLFFCGVATAAWQKQRRRPRDLASPRSLRRATAHAASLAGLWGVLTVVWFGDATMAQKMTIATLVTGMIGAGSFVLSPLPLASLAYVGVFSVAALWALWRAADPAIAGVAVLVLLYAPMVAVGSLAAWRKATALIQAQTQSARQEQLLSMLLSDFEQQAGEALWEMGADGRLRHPSSRLVELLSLATEHDPRLDQPLLHWMHAHSPPAAARLREALDAGRPFRDLHLPWPVATGQRHLSISGKRLIDDNGQTRGWRGVLADVSDKVERDSLLRRLAHTDSLTGLCNRFVLRDSLAQALRQGQAVALLSIDLDHFKSINDSHGHSAGDELLKAVATRLQACVRPDDLVARLGGDEFAVLLLDPPPAPEPARLAGRVIQTLSEPMEVGGRRLRVGASVGVTQCAAASTSSVDEMLVQADMALYAAKEAGRGRPVVYEPALGEQSHRRLAIEEGLRQAIARNELSLHWQAKVDIARWQVTGAEALLRWTHPTLGRVGPGEFIGVAEQCGLIDELGRWALNQACREAATHLHGLTVSVNVSPMQLRDPGFVAFVRQALRDAELPATRLELEITESVFMDDADGALEQLHALRDLGLRVALDDFGTGYSSLSYLRRFPFDTLKVGRAFINELLLQRDARAIVQMIANLATTLGICTVCEGVETVEQLRAVSEAGCDQVQGYLISQPRPLDELLALQRHWQAEPPTARALH